MSVLYFKRVYPRAKIIAFEPNPKTFKLLKLNVKQNNLKNVKLIKAALSGKKGKAALYEDEPPWSWGSAIVKNTWNMPRENKINVMTLKLSEYMDQSVDFLKLDVEGAETRVLKEAEPKLIFVNQLVMEFHGNIKNKENRLEEVLNLLDRNNFSYTIRRAGWPIKWPIKAEDVINKKPYWLIIRAKRSS